MRDERGLVIITKKSQKEFLESRPNKNLHTHTHTYIFI